MVICKFFLQGTCKYGDFCKLEHQLNDNHNSKNSASVLRQSQLGNIQQQPKPPRNPSNVDTDTLIKIVVDDMTGAEKGGQWLLSCYAPFREKPMFPGFEEYSSEEIRLGYYDAVKNGTVERYKQQVQSLLQQAVMRIRSLQAPSPDIVNVLKSVYNTPAASYCAVFGSNTAKTTTAFANPVNLTNTSGAFGSQQITNFVQQPNSSIFPKSKQNICGKPSQHQNQFRTPSNSIFGGTSQNNQAFGQANNFIFANDQVQMPSTSNIFQQAHSSFVPQSNNPIFSGQSPTTQVHSSGTIFAARQPAGHQTSPPSNASISVFKGQQSPSSTSGTQPRMQTNAGKNCNRCEDCLSGLKSVPSLIKTIDSLKVELEDVKKIVKDAPVQNDEYIINEIYERQLKAKNVMIYNLPEDVNNVESDLTKVQEIFREITNEEPNIVRLQRVGKKNKNGARALKIVLSNAEDAFAIIRQRRNLKGERKIFIEADLTTRQKTRMKEVKRELHGRRNGGEQGLYINVIVLTETWSNSNFCDAELGFEDFSVYLEIDLKTAYILASKVVHCCLQFCINRIWKERNINSCVERYMNFCENLGYLTNFLKIYAPCLSSDAEYISIIFSLLSMTKYIFLNN